VDQVMTLGTNKMGLKDGLGGKRSRLHWMSEGRMLLQLDPLDHHFDPEGQVPTPLGPHQLSHRVRGSAG